MILPLLTDVAERLSDGDFLCHRSPSAVQHPEETLHVPLGKHSRRKDSVRP